MNRDFITIGDCQRMLFDKISMNADVRCTSQTLWLWVLVMEPVMLDKAHRTNDQREQSSLPVERCTRSRRRK